MFHAVCGVPGVVLPLIDTHIDTRYAKTNGNDTRPLVTAGVSDTT